MACPQNILIGNYDYPLPQHRIAQHPLAQRDSCKLLVKKQDQDPVEHVFNELPSLLPDNAVLVYNNTRVINARLRSALSLMRLPIMPKTSPLHQAAAGCAL